MQNPLKIILNGIFKENPTFALVLGMCPTIAVTTSAANGLSMGLAAAAVLIGSNVAISALRRMWSAGLDPPKPPRPCCWPA